MRPATRLALLVGWLGYALIPWYLPDGMSLTGFGWLAGYPFGKDAGLVHFRAGIPSTPVPSTWIDSLSAKKTDEAASEQG